MVHVSVIPDESQAVAGKQQEGKDAARSYDRHFSETELIQSHGNYEDDEDYEDEEYDDDDDDDDDDLTNTFPSTLLEKILALKYLIPFTFRSRCHQVYQMISYRTRQFSVFISRGVWVMTTSLFLIGFPIFFEYQKEQQLIMMEKEQRLFPAPPSSQASLSAPI